MVNAKGEDDGWERSELVSTGERGKSTKAREKSSEMGGRGGEEEEREMGRKVLHRATCVVATHHALRDQSSISGWTKLGRPAAERRGQHECSGSNIGSPQSLADSEEAYCGDEEWI